MAIREEIVASAVTFLQDPSVAGSPIENRVAFLQSKNLTQEEIETALARTGGETAPATYTNYAPQQQVMRSPPSGYGGYQQAPWPRAPPEVPRRDWRDWFIMATVMGGVSYGLYCVAKRYVYPLIAPPTPPQLEQDKQAIDESFEKAFALLDQLAKDTETLKSAEQTRTERLDAAMTEVEQVISELKAASKRREEESRRMGEEVRGLKDLIPRAMDGQKETTDSRLRELNAELKSLKTLMGQRMNPAASSSTGSYGRAPGFAASIAPTPPSPSPTPLLAPAAGSNGGSTTPPSPPKPASVSNGTGTESVASISNRNSSTFNSGAPAGRAAIPSWQMKSTNATSTAGAANGSRENSESHHE